MSTSRLKAAKRSNSKKHTLEMLAKRRNLSKLAGVIVSQSTTGLNIESKGTVLSGKIICKATRSTKVITKANVSRPTPPRNISKIEREKMENTPVNENLIAKSKTLNFEMVKP